MCSRTIVTMMVATGQSGSVRDLVCVPHYTSVLEDALPVYRTHTFVVAFVGNLPRSY